MSISNFLDGASIARLPGKAEKCALGKCAVKSPQRGFASVAVRDARGGGEHGTCDLELAVRAEHNGHRCKRVDEQRRIDVLDRKAGADDQGFEGFGIMACSGENFGAQKLRAHAVALARGEPRQRRVRGGDQRQCCAMRLARDQGACADEQRAAVSSRRSTRISAAER